LVDVETGEVVGINAAIRAHMEGTSFAIPINRVREIMNDLAEGREIRHGYLGISLATCTPDWARQINSDVKDSRSHIPEIYGALVHNVFPRTPAEVGGLKTNDVILDIGGKRVQSSDDARKLIDGAPVGEVRMVLRSNDSQYNALSANPRLPPALFNRNYGYLFCETNDKLRCQ
jgi:S1-C subfamily serine protease